MAKTRTHTCRECGVQYEIPADLLWEPEHGYRCEQALVEQMKKLRDENQYLRDEIRDLKDRDR